MAVATGEVVPGDGEGRFKVVFKQHGVLLSEWSVESIEEGERQIAAALRGLQDEARRQGYID